MNNKMNQTVCSALFNILQILIQTALKTLALAKHLLTKRNTPRSRMANIPLAISHKPNLQFRRDVRDN